MPEWSRRSAKSLGPEPAIRSAVPSNAWVTVQETLYGGLVHALNNCVAALSGIVQPQDEGLVAPVDGTGQLRSKVNLLCAMMDLLRVLMARRGERREPVRMGDAMRDVQALLAHHPVARQWTLTIADESPDAQPVLLWPSDPLRFAALLWLTAGRNALDGELRAAVLRHGSQTQVSVVAAGVAATVRKSVEFAALAAAAEAERRALTARDYAGKTSVEVTLALLGLSRAAPRS